MSCLLDSSVLRDERRPELTRELVPNNRHSPSTRSAILAGYSPYCGLVFILMYTFLWFPHLAHSHIESILKTSSVCPFYESHHVGDAPTMAQITHSKEVNRTLCKWVARCEGRRHSVYDAQVMGYNKHWDVSVCQAPTVFGRHREFVD